MNMIRIIIIIIITILFVIFPGKSRTSFCAAAGDNDDGYVSFSVPPSSDDVAAGGVEKEEEEVDDPCGVMYAFAEENGGWRYLDAAIASRSLRQFRAVRQCARQGDVGETLQMAVEFSQRGLAFLAWELAQELHVSTEFPGAGEILGKSAFIARAARKYTDCERLARKAVAVKGDPREHLYMNYELLTSCVHRQGHDGAARVRTIHEEAARRHVYPSQNPWQPGGSVAYMENLRGKPIWSVKDLRPGNGRRFVAMLRSNYKAIRREFKEYNAKGGFMVDEVEGLASARGQWQELQLYDKGFANKPACAHFTTTCAIVRKYLRSASAGDIKFSRLEPWARIYPHSGPVNYKLRMHLSIEANPHAVLHIRPDITLSWREEGNVFIFDETFEHEVWNNATSRRTVLIVDLWHPDLDSSVRKKIMRGRRREGGVVVEKKIRI